MRARGILAVGTLPRLTLGPLCRAASLSTQTIMLAFVTYTLAYGIRYTYSLFHFANVILVWLAFVHFKAKISMRQASARVQKEDVLLDSQVDLHSTVPAEHEAHNQIPDSLKASLTNLKGYTIDREGNVGGEEAAFRPDPGEALDDLLEKYLELLDEYFACKKNVADRLAGGHFQLSKAWMQLGRLTFNDGWDGRMKASTSVRVTDTGLPILETIKEGGQDKTDGLLVERKEMPVLRRRKVGDKDVAGKESSLQVEQDSHSEKDKGGQEAAEKKEPQPFNPLYQFAALPPPSLRQSQSHFAKALEILIGKQDGRGLLQIQADLQRLELRIAAAQRAEP